MNIIIQHRSTCILVTKLLTMTRDAKIYKIPCYIPNINSDQIKVS